MTLRSTRITDLAARFMLEGAGPATALHRALQAVSAAPAARRLARRLWARALANAAIARQAAAGSLSPTQAAAHDLRQTANLASTEDDRQLLSEAAEQC